MKTYLYRLGDGNEGCFPCFIINLADDDDPYAAIRALVENRYIAGRRVRRYIVANIDTDGEPEYGISATVYEGPEGEQAFGAAWICAELEPLGADDMSYYVNRGFHVFDRLRDAVDTPAWRRYRAALKVTP